MPKAWIYYIALILPLLFSVLVSSTFFTNWLWYAGYEDMYYFLTALSVNPMFLEFVGGWPFVVFVGTVICYWRMDEDHDAIDKQFFLLPLVYVPFSIIGTALTNLSFDASTLYSHPLVIIPGGYMYLLPWILFVWVFTKLRLLVE